MQQYALIMRHEDGGKLASPEQMQEWMQQTMNWIHGIVAQNKFVSGIGLPFDQARVVANIQNELVVSPGPFGAVRETIGGYIIINADSIEEAVTIAKGCPVLQGEGNSVEVRMIASS